MQKNTEPTAAILIIGNEILSGRTKDVNLNYLGLWLAEIGIDLQEGRFIMDNHVDIIHAVHALKQRYTYVFTSGGIGPTHDDITADAIAACFERPIDIREDARLILENYYGAENLTDARLRMARIPEGAGLIDNPISGAPGFYIDNVFVLAGVPKIQQAMLESLKHLLTGSVPLQSVSMTVDALESQIAHIMAEAQNHFPDVGIGSYPFSRDGRFGTRIVVRGRGKTKLDHIMDSMKQKIVFPIEIG